MNDHDQNDNTNLRNQQQSESIVMENEGNNHPLLDITFQDLKYSISFNNGPREFKRCGARNPDSKETKFILNGMTGIFKGGHLTAVMGPSGCGKTSILNVMANNVDPSLIDGQIKLNGIPCIGSKLREISGIVFQDDVLLATMTVKEVIRMSAKLRLPKTIGKGERERRVQNALRMFNLTKARNTIIGSPLEAGISGGERKRVCIAMEVIINPAILLLDEPTTGLDTFTAFSIIKILKRMAHRQGRTIVATIHQPSTDIFNLFDDVIFIDRGQIMYCGPVNQVIEYFNQLGYKCPITSNPVDYIFMHLLREFNPKFYSNLIDIDEDNNARIEYLLNKWPKSPEYNEMIQKIHQINNKIENAQSGNGNKNNRKREMGENVFDQSFKAKASFSVQFKFLFGRAFKNTYRNPLMIQTRLAQSIIIGLILGLLYVNVDSRPLNERIQNKAGVLFFIAVNQYIGSATQILYIFYEEKYVFFREYEAGYYGSMAYFLSKVIVELPYQILCPFLLVLVAYYIVGLNPGFGHYLLAGLLAALASICGAATGTFISILFRDINIALAILPTMLIPLMLFAGFLVNVQSAPAYLSWTRFISAVYYSFTGMIKNEFSDPNISSIAFNVLNFTTSISVGVDIVFLLTIYLALIISAYLLLVYKIHKRK